MAGTIRVCIETGEKRVFASAMDWPGWARGGRTEAEAIEKLVEYAPRYARVALAAGIAFPEHVTVSDIEVEEHVIGNATTDYGVPAAVSKAESRGYSPAQAGRMTALLDAAWSHLDRVIATAPADLRKGPRGGGRDRDKIYEHVVGAEFDAYARKIGLRLKVDGTRDRAGIRAGRGAIIDALARPYDGAKPEGKNWPPAYMARRTAWHALDHAWEIEDRSD